MEAAGRRWGWTPDRMDEPSELLKAQRRAGRVERAEQLEHSSDAQQQLRAAERCVSKAPTHTHTHPHTHTANGLGSLLPPRALANANGWRGRWISLRCALARAALDGGRFCECSHRPPCRDYPWLATSTRWGTGRNRMDAMRRENIVQNAAARSSVAT